MDCRLYQKGVKRSGMLGLRCWTLGVECWLFASSVLSQTTPTQPLSPTNQDWRDSLAVLNQQIARQPWSTDLHLRKAAVNLELKQWQYAVDEYSEVLRHDAKNPAALFYRAYAHTHLRHYELARNDYSDLLTIAPRHFEARLSLALILQQMGKRKEALDQLNQTIELHPDSAMGYAARANLERDMKQDEVALYDWAKAEQLDERNPLFVVSHVDLLLVLERREEARRVLDAAVVRGIPKGMLLEWYEKCKRK